MATLLARNQLLRLRLALRPDRPVVLGARNQGFSLEQSTAYVDWVFDDYRAQGLDDELVSGARILELGPGDTLGVALRLFAAGASQVVCLDRFVTARDPGQQRRIHAALREAMPARERERLAGVLADDGELIEGQQAVILIEGTGVEESDQVLEGRFDAILSRAVLAHLTDLQRGYEAMDRLLAPSGAMLHKVDLSDHRLFTEGGHNPLTFLTIPDVVWDRMRSHTGLPNREMVDRHRELLRALGYEPELPATKLIGSAEELSPPRPLAELGDELVPARPLAEGIRPRLLPRYRKLPEVELATAGVFITARKPPAAVAGEAD